MKHLLLIFFAGLVVNVLTAEEKEVSMDTNSYNNLTAEEEKVIVHKGTEAPFVGKFNDFFEPGIYRCKRCNAPLYKSEDKFSSNCGWPSFDDEIPGAVKRQLDPDGIRTEILCSNCNAHLGHVFQGEKLTDKNSRHCVNSISLLFTPNPKAYFAGGCFWGVEYLMEHKTGVVSAVSGFMGGKTKNPTYREVCSQNTGHLETVEVTYDLTKLSYEELVKFFFEIHDPQQKNGQGPDLGEQYLSAVFYSNDQEKATISKLIKILESKGFKIATKVLPAQKFWKAEDDHQDYYEKNHKKPYCHIYHKKFDLDSHDASIYDFSVRDIEGKEVHLSDFKGKVLLIVNVASRCGFTPQYEGLEKLYKKLGPKGLVILGFPANNFLWQEPGTDEEIRQFCSFKYHVTFPMFSKISVKGKNKHPLYQFLTSNETNPEFSGEISWNFNKFLIDRSGKIAGRFGSRDAPENENMVRAIEMALEKSYGQ